MTAAKEPVPSKTEMAAARRVQKKRNWPMLILTYVAIIVSLTALVGVLTIRERSDDLRNGLRDNCVDTFTPSHNFYQAQLAQAQAHGVRYYHELFPDYPIDQLRQDIIDNKANLAAAIEAYDPANCDDLVE